MEISITAMGSISPLGSTQEEVWQNYLSPKHLLQTKKIGQQNFAIGKIFAENQNIIQKIRKENPKYNSLDPSVLYAIYASREALRKANWSSATDFGVNIGSSRGATSLFEEYYKFFLEKGTCPPLTSPTTTLGNIASWVMQDAQGKGISISHSIACSTALHALLNGVAWLRAGMAEQFLVGGSEAPLTNFTIMQMNSLKIYGDASEKYPSLPLFLSKKRNSMVLGEGSAVFCLEKGISPRSLAVIRGLGYATEAITHNISISENADCFISSMKMAMKDISPNEIDVIIPHNTGTIKGDMAEIRAISYIFRDKIPLLTTNKWKIGHTFGASGAFSLEMALLMLKKQYFIPVPYINYPEKTEKIRNILINSVGFGGNAVSIIVSLPENNL
ncbi:MAG: beta-ketoacyl synthase N-terminal-like domain-containing protein [Capnocytophaga sp.]|nr:beta-ketoacyl synthase N-terminal-like domain-containing protein [Capnocytophaga sp.]